MTSDFNTRVNTANILNRSSNRILTTILHVI